MVHTKKIALGALVIASMATAVHSEAPHLDNLDVEALAKSVTLEGALVHLEKFQQIAESQGGHRVAGSSGYDLSSHYVSMKLIEAGYDVKLQSFSFDRFKVLEPSTFAQTAPKEETFLEEESFNTMSYSPSGSVTAPVQSVDLSLGEGNASTSGCEIEDFEGFPKGHIALVQRGTCSFVTKAQNAAASGASGVIVFNQGNDEGRKELFNGTLGKNQLSLPVFSVSYDLGVRFAEPGTVLQMHALTESKTALTHNVIAETPGGNPDNIVMIGSHLDSVEAGPGINDNGSGSASILEVALKLRHITPTNKVRFAWWGAEEHGLVGSRHYTAKLTDEEADRIALYLNFDMVASKNFIYGIYDSDGSKFEVPGPKGSAAIEKLFHDYFAFMGDNTIEVEANGRSDYVGFAERGIPFGGSFTGAEVAKTSEQVRLFGGVEGESYDACYHKACDDLTNISHEALQKNLQMIAYATLSFARSTADVDKEKSLQDSLPLAFDPFRSARPKFDPNQYPEHFECHAHAVWAK